MSVERFGFVVVVRNWVAASACLAAVGCSAGASVDRADSAGGQLTVVTTVSPLTSVAANVAGPHARVVGLVPEGVNSHEFEPRPSDARLLASADLVFVNGLHLETPTVELAKANLRSGARLVEMGEQVVGPDDYVFDFSFPAAAGDPNPHLWTNPMFGVRYAEIYRDELSRAAPDHADDFAANAAAYIGKLTALDRATRAASATVRTRKLLTYHDSFPYFAREYGWTVIGAIQPADFAEPSAREVAELIRQVRAAGVPAIFGSEVFPSDVLERIGKEAGVRYVDSLRDDDLPGDPGDPEHSYLGLLRFDFVTMVDALGGDSSALRALDVADVTQGDVEYRS
ncbi:MAG TPA: metal ABC transporter substrate-binding protein [Mycobacteriales bacterium]|nr:metal ABC transporter substrate-binding protein [Mycobacteriales bacterium]